MSFHLTIHVLKSIHPYIIKLNFSMLECSAKLNYINTEEASKERTMVGTMTTKWKGKTKHISCLPSKKG
jgi:hypothetical protein